MVKISSKFIGQFSCKHVNEVKKSKFTTFGPVISLKVDKIRRKSNQSMGTPRRVTGKNFIKISLSSFPVNVLMKSSMDARTLNPKT